MGYITELKSKTKGTRYKAVINIRKPSEGIEYFDTETFSTRALAKAWLKREEDRLEKNPHLLSTDKDAVASAAMSLASAITRYKSEISDYGRTKAFTLEMLKKFDISQKSLADLKRTDYAQHALRRRDGYKNENYDLDPVEPSTILFEFQCIKSVLDHAELLWGVEINFNEYTITNSELLEACTAEYRSMAEKADGHAIDVERLSEVWPVEKPSS